MTCGVSCMKQKTNRMDNKSEQLTPELAIVQFEEHLKKAEIVPEIDITELHTLAEKAGALVDVDINDEVQMSAVVATRKELVSTRRKIQIDGKSARDEHTRVNKAIKRVEDFLIGILGDDEARLKEFERQRKEKDEKEKRLETLPQRKQLLSSIGDDVVVSDDEILLMDDAVFLNYVTERQSTKAEADKWAEEARQAEEARKNAEAQRVKEAEERAREKAEAEAKARAEAEVKAAELKQMEALRVKQDEIDRMNREKAEAEARVQAEAETEVARQKAEAEEKSKLEAEANYQTWLRDNNFDPTTDKLDDTGLEIVLYRKVAIYSKEI
jgi:hypothetical protein